MVENKKEFAHAKSLLIKNLDTLQGTLLACIQEGMMDQEDASYNQIVELVEDAHLVGNWDELVEIVNHSKTFEIDLAVWLARKGKTSLSLQWPKKPK